MPRIDPALRDVVITAGRGINPFGMKGRATLGPPYNPYFSVVTGLLMTGVAGFVGWQLRDAPGFAILLGVLIFGVGAWLVVWSLRRAPAWHRARHDVAEYLADHPGRFPNELRWYR